MDPVKLERLFEQQLNLMEMLAQTRVPTPAVPSAIPQSADGLANSISEFVYDPEANVTFDTWFRRYEDLFRVDLSDKDDAWKVRLLLRKLGAAELDKYCNLILPQNPRDRTFDATVQSLSQLFGDHRSLFNTRYRCLKLVLSWSLEVILGFEAIAQLSRVREYFQESWSTHFWGVDALWKKRMKEKLGVASIVLGGWRVLKWFQERTK